MRVLDEVVAVVRKGIPNLGAGRIVQALADGQVGLLQDKLENKS